MKKSGNNTVNLVTSMKKKVIRAMGAVALLIGDHVKYDGMIRCVGCWVEFEANTFYKNNERP